MKVPLLQLIASDFNRMHSLRVASTLDLPDWCIAAGFVRNLVWDYLHGYRQYTPLNDVDLIYFDKEDMSFEKDQEIERQLQQRTACNWSVKNQAHMHARNGDDPYQSTQDAMRYWPEIETAVGVKLENSGELTIISPFALQQVLRNSVTINPNRPKPDEFERRVVQKGWLKRWPKLIVNG